MQLCADMSGTLAHCCSCGRTTLCLMRQSDEVKYSHLTTRLIKSVVKWEVHWGCGQTWAVTEYLLISVSWCKYTVCHTSYVLYVIHRIYLDFKYKWRMLLLGKLWSEVRNLNGGESGGVPHVHVTYEHNRINYIWMESQQLNLIWAHYWGWMMPETSEFKLGDKDPPRITR